ncbi:MAG: DUF5665 domain-containing protein [Patescibacteria group bacterium]
MADPDQLSQSKTIFEASWWEIFWRNFLAGMARALGAVILYAVVLVILTNLFMSYIWPVMEPLIQSLEQSTVLFRSLNPGNSVENQPIQ